MQPWGTTASIFAHEKFGLFNMSPSFRSFKKSVKVSNYLKDCFASNYKGDPGAKICQMLLRYPVILQLLHQDKHQKICRSSEW